MSAPKTRQDLEEAIAAGIGWGATADDIKPFVAKLEARGVRFITATATDAMVAAAGAAQKKTGIAAAINAAIAANPYAPPPEDVS